MPTNRRFSLSQKVILLTGGAGMYGSALMSALAETGCQLIVASRDRASLETAAAICSPKIVVDSYDQADESMILALRGRIKEKYGRLDGLINNSVSRPMKSLHGSAQAWDESMAVNARGMMLMHRHFGEMMAAQPQGGSIVNIGSVYGMTGPTTSLYDDMNANLLPDYYFHKAGLINLTRFFAAAYGHRNVRVNCVSAGGFYANQPTAFVERYSAQTFLGRMARGDELAGPVIFLLSSAASYMTGENLVMDGGFTAH